MESTKNSAQEQASGIKMTHGPLEFHSFNETAFGKSATLKQEITTIYPAARPGNSLSDGLFAQDRFGEGQAFPSIRYTVVKVPSDATEEEVKKQIASINEQNPEARIYRILTNNVEDVITAEQKQAFNRGLITDDDDEVIESWDEYMEDRKEAYQVVDAEGNTYYDGNKNPQYRRHLLSLTGKEDVDLRAEGARDSSYVLTEDGELVEANEFLSQHENVGVQDEVQ